MRTSILAASLIPFPRSIVPVTLLLLAAANGLAANDFSSDPNCAGLWRMESGALTTDSSGNGNTLTASASPPTADTANYREGAASGDFELDNSQYLTIADASLSAGFPLKSGDTNKKITVCCWIKPESLPYAGSYRYIVSKYGATTNKRSFALTLYGSSVAVLVGYNAGSSFVSIASTATVAVGKWYHIGAVLDDGNQEVGIRIYDADAGTISFRWGNPGQAVAVADAAFRIGDRADGGFSFDGLIDEVAVFNRALSFDEIDRIRAGTYTGPISYGANNFNSDSSCVALWNFEAGALGTASIGGCNFTTISGAVATHLTYRQGAASAYFSSTIGYNYMRANGDDLPTGFPGTGTSRNLTVCFWFRPSAASWLVNLESTWAVRAIDNTSPTGLGIRAHIGNGTISTGVAGANYCLDPSEWSHVAFTWDNATRTAYLRVYRSLTDAVIDDEVTDGSYPSMYCGKPTLELLGLGNPVGRMDELVVFNRVLSSSEIDAIRTGTFGSVGGGPVGFF